MLLIEPTMAYAKDIEAYRQEFLDIEGSMDGCGSLRRCATGAEWIEKCRLGKDPATVPAHLVPATQFIYVRDPAFLRNSNGRLDLPGPAQEAA